MTRMLTVWLCACVCVCVSLASACATVAPYERERLSKPDMTEPANASDLTAGNEHAIAYREGSSGGLGTSAGGCGCN